MSGRRGDRKNGGNVEDMVEDLRGTAWMREMVALLSRLNYADLASNRGNTETSPELNEVYEIIGSRVHGTKHQRERMVTIADFAAASVRLSLLAKHVSYKKYNVRTKSRASQELKRRSHAGYWATFITSTSSSTSSSSSSARFSPSASKRRKVWALQDFVQENLRARPDQLEHMVHIFYQADITMESDMLGLTPQDMKELKLTIGMRNDMPVTQEHHYDSAFISLHSWICWRSRSLKMRLLTIRWVSIYTSMMPR